MYMNFQIGIGTIPIPKTSHVKRLVENIDIFDFNLNEEEIAVVDGFNSGQRIWPLGEKP